MADLNMIYGALLEQNKTLGAIQAKQEEAVTERQEMRADIAAVKTDVQAVKTAQDRMKQRGLGILAGAGLIGGGAGGGIFDVVKAWLGMGGGPSAGG